MSFASLTNNDGVTQPRGSVVRADTAPNTCLLALADTLAHCQRLVGFRLGDVGAGTAGPVGNLNNGMIVVLSASASAGDTIYLSASSAGQGTNVAPTIKVILGVAYQVFTLAGTYYAQLLIPSRQPSTTRIWEVGQGENQYPTVQAAIDAIAADLVPPSQNSPAQILVYPGKYTMTAPLTIPAWTNVHGTDRFAVQFYNTTSDMFICSGNVSFSQFTILASATSFWAILGNNKVNVWIQDIYFSTNSGTGTQGLLYCTGSTYFGIRIDRLWASTRMTSGYLIQIENTSADARDVDVQFTNLLTIAAFMGGGGGILRFIKTLNSRIRDCDVRVAAGRGISHEQGGAASPSTMNVICTVGAGGNPLYTEVGTSVTVDNCSLPGSSINGASTVRNSTT